RFWDQALYSSGDRQIWPPSSAKVFLKLCGLKYARLAAAKASLKIARIGPALLQCLRSSPDASKCRLSPTTIFVAGNSGSSSPQSFSCRRYTLRRIEVRPGLDHIEGRLQGLRTRCSLRRLKEAARQPAAEALGAGRPGLSVAVDVEIGEAGVIRGMEQLGRLRQPDQDVGLLRLLLIVF